MNLIEEFQIIRNIPYSIPLSDTEINNTCSGKVIRLKKVFDDAGFETRYQVCDFLWSDLPIPRAVLSLPHDDQSTHVFLQVNINDKWIDLDPTWDLALRNVFPVVEWDGESSTKIAVKPLRLYSYEESRHIMEQSNPEEGEIELKRNFGFFDTLNKWLDGQRAKSI